MRELTSPMDANSQSRKVKALQPRLFANTVFGLDSVSIGFAVCSGALLLNEIVSFSFPEFH